MKDCGLKPDQYQDDSWLLAPSVVIDKGQFRPNHFGGLDAQLQLTKPNPISQSGGRLTAAPA